MSLFSTLYHRLPLIRELDRVLKEMAVLNASLLRELEHHRSIQCLEIIERLRREKEDAEGPACLHRFECQVCSQHGEDGVIAEIFRRIGVNRREFVEVGIGDGLENNTAFLLSCGWTGTWLDACPLPYPPPEGLSSRASFVTRENICTLFTDLGVSPDVDLCSLDIDQNTYHVWTALTGWRPRVVVVEYNASIPASVDWIAAYRPDRVWDGTINFGASLKAFERLGRDLGYTLVHCDLSGANAFFVRNDLVGTNFSGPFDAETQYEPPRYALDYRSGHRPSFLDRNQGLTSRRANHLPPPI